MVQPLTVSELTKQIKWALGGPAFQNVAVEGEVSNFVHHSSGHMYFSLKDAQSRIKAVMFRSRNQRLSFRPQNGDVLIAVGSISVYEPNGEYQLYVDELFPGGVGLLHQAFEQLKARLEAEGLFDPARKRPLPLLPRRVGVITSPTGAAVRDIVQVLTRRCPSVSILLFPALVQGDGAPESLISALQQAQDTDCEVLILGRGGGSFEELNAFNDEGLARAIARSAIPVVSAVGHETDFTIADFVADLRAPTPSAAAELVVPLQEELKSALTAFEQRIAGALQRRIRAERRYLKQLSQNQVLLRPDYRLNQLRQRVDELWSGLDRQSRHQLALRRGELGSLAGRLEALSPLKTLGRGYAICRTLEGEVVRSTLQVDEGEVVDVTLREGNLLCRVEGRNQ